MWGSLCVWSAVITKRTLQELPIFKLLLGYGVTCTCLDPSLPWKLQMCMARSTALWPKTFHTGLRILTISKYFFQKNNLDALEVHKKLNTLEGRLAQQSSDWWLLAWQNSASINENMTFAKKHCMIICKAMAILPTQKAHVIILNCTQKPHFYSILFFFFCNECTDFFQESTICLLFLLLKSQFSALAKLALRSWHFSHQYDQCQSLQKWNF